MSQYIISAEHIQKKYNGIPILRDVSVHVRKGDIYGLVGKNGSGKTTLLRILTGQIRKYGGAVSIKGSDGRRLALAAVINSPSLFLNMSASENMREQLFLLGMRDQSKSSEILKIVELESCGNKPVRNFSLGMTQRLRLGLALLEDPDILILDEPVNGLDPDGIASLRELLLRLNRTKGMTIIISSHILSELEQMITILGILHDGRIVKEASAREILQNGNTLEQVYMQSTNGGCRYA